MTLCDRCADRQVARITGFPELPDPPQPLVLRDPSGRHHELVARLWRAPTGIVLELEESHVPPGEGFHFAVLGGHDVDVMELLAKARHAAEGEVGRQYLKQNPYRPGWLARDDVIAGRLVWNEGRGAGEPYDVVVDGRTLSWDELGGVLESFEGCRFRLVLEDRCDDLRPDASVIPLVSDD